MSPFLPCEAAFGRQTVADAFRRRKRRPGFLIPFDSGLGEPVSATFGVASLWGRPKWAQQDKPCRPRVGRFRYRRGRTRSRGTRSASLTRPLVPWAREVFSPTAQQDGCLHFYVTSSGVRNLFHAADQQVRRVMSRSWGISSCLVFGNLHLGGGKTVGQSARGSNKYRARNFRLRQAGHERSLKSNFPHATRGVDMGRLEKKTHFIVVPGHQPAPRACRFCTWSGPCGGGRMGGSC